MPPRRLAASALLFVIACGGSGSPDAEDGSSGSGSGAGDTSGSSAGDPATTGGAGATTEAGSEGSSGGEPAPPPMPTMLPSSAPASSRIAMKPRSWANTSTSFNGGIAKPILNLRGR